MLATHFNTADFFGVEVARTTHFVNHILTGSRVDHAGDGFRHTFSYHKIVDGFGETADGDIIKIIDVPLRRQVEVIRHKGFEVGVTGTAYAGLAFTYITQGTRRAHIVQLGASNGARGAKTQHNIIQQVVFQRQVRQEYIVAIAIGERHAVAIYAGVRLTGHRWRGQRYQGLLQRR